MTAPYNWQIGKRVKMLINAQWKFGIVTCTDTGTRYCTVVYIEWDHLPGEEWPYIRSSWKYIKRCNRVNP